MNSTNGLVNNVRWRKLNRMLEEDVLPGLIVKFQIGAHDLYLKTVWHQGEIVRIDLTLSGRDEDESLLKTGREVSAEADRYDLARSSIEALCAMASDMLMTGVVDIDYVIGDWAGREMYPDGVCPQIEAIVKGPIDGAAKLMRARFGAWRKHMLEVENAAISS